MPKAAAGVHQIEEALNQVHIRQGLLAELYCETMFTEIATTEWFDGLECGTQVTVMHEPDFEFRDYEKDQKLEVETPKVCTTTFGADYAKYAFIKLDDLDKKYVCQYNLLRPAFEKKIRQKTLEVVEGTIFNHIYHEAHEMNQGSTAGESGMYNLGRVGAPFVATPDSMFDLMLYDSGVLDDQCTEDSERWLVLPKEAKVLFGQGLLGKTVLNGGCNICTDARNGKMYEDLSGLDIYFSSRLPKCIDPITGDTTWITPFGQKQGMGYTLDMGNFEVLRLEDAFADAVRILVTFGAGAGRPELLGFNYITMNIGG